MPDTPFPPELLERARRIRLACFDVDGTLTDGRLHFDDEGREHKAFHAQDGLGLALLRKHGIEVALITARKSRVTEIRGAELGLTEVHTAAHDKLAMTRAIAAKMGIDMTCVAFMGDDLVDLGVFPHVGLAVAPANAHAWTAPHAHWITPREGGHGAARDFCDLLLEARDKREAVLAAFGAGA
ncbi:phenylphosphate carboxylase subunit delta [Lysobacter pythonis]|uniref:3-deoxy-D-manno-octulosonate 8-phosphate phosphatase KdsC n=1 Tax=Solilutibacter pythonis TaxID=2483112 RepID=A0A3M2HWK3_9GAMM|nr:HAD hydrolase family protein [Lysobacter pythonis]RMH94111.1 phenylphosphate carboxylase subunit delta [Lysobacter pythonis]